MLNRTLLLALVSAAAFVQMTSAQTRRPFKLDDIARMKNINDPQCSPDGKSVAYTMSQIDAKEDRNGNGHIWMINYDGSGNRQITSSEQSEGSPRFSPDGKYLSFTSSRPGPAPCSQVWLLPTAGG